MKLGSESQAQGGTEDILITFKLFELKLKKLK